jgi:hypothetical protein
MQEPDPGFRCDIPLRVTGMWQGRLTKPYKAACQLGTSYGLVLHANRRVLMNSRVHFSGKQYITGCASSPSRKDSTGQHLCRLLCTAPATGISGSIQHVECNLRVLPQAA